MEKKSNRKIRYRKSKTIQGKKVGKNGKLHNPSSKTKLHKVINTFLKIWPYKKIV